MKQTDLAPLLASVLALAGAAGLGLGCGKSSTGGREASSAAPSSPSPSAAPSSPSTPAPAGAAGHAGHAHHEGEARVPLASREVTLPLPTSPGGSARLGALLLGEGAELALLDLETGAISAVPAPGPELRLFPTAAVHGELMAAIAILDRGEEHAEQLALVDLSGKQPARLVGPTGQVVRNPSFSADGKHVFFEASHKSFRDVYRLDVPAAAAKGAAALGETARLTDNREGNFAPSLSADGKRLAFASSRDGDSELYSMELAAPAASPGSASAKKGSAPASSAAASPALTRLTAFHRDDWGPLWNPAQKSGAGELSFLSDREGIDRIFIVAGDGTQLRRATSEPSPKGSKVVESQPAWSSQGALAYLRTADNRNELRAGAPGTASWHALTAPDAIAESFAWSPDGQWLAAIELPTGETTPAGAKRKASHGHARLLLVSANGEHRVELLSQIDAETTVRWVP